MIVCSPTIEFRFFPRRLSRPCGRSSRKGFATMGAALVLCVVLGQLPQAEADSTSAALVRQLGVQRFADRQAAALELERIGSRACPHCALRGCHATWKSKPAAQDLLVKIETALLTQPTSVRLDFDMRHTLRRGDLAQQSDRLQDRALSAKPAQVDKSASPSVTPRVRLSGRLSTSSAMLHRSSTTLECKDLPVTRTRSSRSPKG